MENFQKKVTINLVGTRNTEELPRSVKKNW